MATALFAAEPSTKPRAISYSHMGDIPRLFMQQGYQLELTLDPSEEILFVGAGLADYKPNFLKNVAIIKFDGTDLGKKTDLRILCKSGNEYSFLIEEVSKRRDVQADLNVFVRAEDDEAKRAMLAPPKLFTADQVAEIQNRANAAEAALQKAQEQRNAAVSQAAQKEFASLDCNYQFYDRKGEDFHPSACSDGRFTTISVNAQEKPSIYELRDGKLSLVQWTPAGDGRYVIPKVVEKGELAVGKSHTKFKKVS